MDKAGNLYGTTDLGGTGRSGTVFELTPDGEAWKETVLYIFTGGVDGGRPEAPLTRVGSALIGTTSDGGDTGLGTVFALQKVNGSWTEEVLYSFRGFDNDGAVPIAGALILDKSGNIYGTTESGGPSNAGSVFELQRAGNTWSEKVLYFFKGELDGSMAYGGLTFDPDGNLYGTTRQGGQYTAGTVFELSPSNGTWKESVLYSFSGRETGASPLGSLVRDRNGNLFGTAGEDAFGAGVVFELSPSGGAWTETVLYLFSGGKDGGYPGAGLLIFEGHLLGTTFSGGNNDSGVVFALTHH
jgi:uncharacterized repeat protein (TIGR03803 family)